MKCEICKSQISTTFLEKIVGTVVKDQNGKMHYFCSDCQHKLMDKKKLLEALK